MSKYLMARVIKGTDTWYESISQDTSPTHSFSAIKNENLAIEAPCDQKGYDMLYSIGKTLWANDMCSKFEIAAFDDDNLFWKTSPDGWEHCRYDGWFESMIAEELKSFHSEDFQNDPLETAYVLDYQYRFWDNKTHRLSPWAFERLIDDTKLYNDISTVYQWIEQKESELPLDALSDMSYIPKHCGFNCNGQLILNPFYDPTLRFEVEPVSYYGKENIRKYLSKMKKHISIQSQIHKPLDDKIIAAEQQKNSRSPYPVSNTPSPDKELIN